MAGSSTHLWTSRRPRVTAQLLTRGGFCTGFPRESSDPPSVEILECTWSASLCIAWFAGACRFAAPPRSREVAPPCGLCASLGEPSPEKLKPSSSDDQEFMLPGLRQEMPRGTAGFSPCRFPSVSGRTNASPSTPLAPICRVAASTAFNFYKLTINRALPQEKTPLQKTDCRIGISQFRGDAMRAEEWDTGEWPRGPKVRAAKSKMQVEQIEDMTC